MAAPPKDVAQLQAGLLEEGRQVMIAVRLELGHDLLPTICDLRADVLQDEGLRLLVEDDLRSRWQEWETLLHLSFEFSTSQSGQSPVPRCELELLAVVADEVQNGED